MSILLINYANKNNIILNVNNKNSEGDYILLVAFQKHNIEMILLLMSYAK